MEMRVSGLPAEVLVTLPVTADEAAALGGGTAPQTMRLQAAVAAVADWAPTPLVAFLHDCARHLPGERLLTFARV